MKSYELKATGNKNLFRVVNRKGDWTHYFYKPTGQYLRAVSFILDTGYAKGFRFYEWLKNKSAEEAEKILKSAGDRGDAVHQFIAKIFREKGKVNRLTKVLSEDNKTERILTDDEFDAILAFQSFWNAHKPRLITYEMTVFNLKEEYAGTLDAVIRLTQACGVKTCRCDKFIGKIGVYDWKSGGGIYDSHGAQVAAYGVAENFKQFLGQQKAEYTAVLRIGTNHKTIGGYEFQPYDRDKTNIHWKEFLAAKQISDADYKPFDPAKKIYEIPIELNMKIEQEIIGKPKVAPKVKTQKRNENTKGSPKKS